jgi:hypothetical protein
MVELLHKKQEQRKRKYLIHDDVKGIIKVLDEKIAKQRNERIWKKLKEGLIEATNQSKSVPKKKKSFKYINPLTQDRSELTEQSGGLSYLLRSTSR